MVFSRNQPARGHVIHRCEYRVSARSDNRMMPCGATMVEPMCCISGRVLPNIRSSTTRARLGNRPQTVRANGPQRGTTRRMTKAKTKTEGVGWEEGPVLLVAPLGGAGVAVLSSIPVIAVVHRIRTSTTSKAGMGTPMGDIPIL
ncbi:hypothetical protein F5B21DRAFT_457094 [Xylaria acuta]|nr:hypothetical protein F5B21DRAFT_457094 [Xylaria acuta]